MNHPHTMDDKLATEPTQRAMAAAVNMEVHAALSTMTIAKARELDGHFPGYDDMLAALRLVSGIDLHHSVLVVVDAAIAKAEGKS